MTPVDGGGLPVFDGDPERLPMELRCISRPRDGALFAIVGGRVGPAEGYLWQYRLTDNGSGGVRATKVRAFGRFSGAKEIESIAVDAELGHVYYSDEGKGVRQYAADPDAPDANRELAFFATDGFAGDHEGISIYPTGPAAATSSCRTRMERRSESSARRRAGRPHAHPFLKEVPLAAESSDGSDVTAADLGPRFPAGSSSRCPTIARFTYYSWAQLAGRSSRRARADSA
jgi:3-phytase